MILHIIFILINLVSVYALPSPSETTTEEDWIVYVPAGQESPASMNNTMRLSDSNSGLTFLSTIQDDNPDSFNAVVVRGTESSVRALAGEGALLVKNQKWTLYGGKKGDDRRHEIEEAEPESVEEVEIEAEEPELPHEDWGLHKIAQRDFYLGPTSGGIETDVYIIDSGIKTDLPEFEGRAIFDTSFSSDNSMEDTLGHGTAVASIVAGARAGVAKNATLIGVQVANADGSVNTAAVLAAIQWTIKKAKLRGKPSVVVFSLGGTPDDAMDDAVQNLVRLGLYPVVAAGNEGGDACNYSPSRLQDVLTVGASQYDDNLGTNSNQGSCVDLFAPGIDVTVANLDGGYERKSGTSFSTPYAAGVMALGLTEKRFENVIAGFEWIKSISTKDSLKGLTQNTVNLRLTNGIQGECTAESCTLA